MKSLYFIPAFLLLTYFEAMSQYIGDVPLREIQSPYIELTTEVARNGVHAYIEHGQNIKSSFKDRLLTDEKGMPLHFNSKTHALNFMLEQGYELAEIYTLSLETSGYVYFILRKKKI